MVAEVARQAHNLEVGGSNPSPATKRIYCGVEKWHLTGLISQSSVKNCRAVRFPLPLLRLKFFDILIKLKNFSERILKDILSKVNKRCYEYYIITIV